MQGPLIWTILTSSAAGAVILKGVETLIAWLTGRHGREQSAWEQRDAEARARRKLEETLHQTRLLAIKRGIAEDDLPEWPAYDTHGKKTNP